MTLRQEAATAETSPARLRELARRGLGRVVAQNPNTPPDLLLKLAAHYFESFAQNPALPLLLLEDPGFCMQMSVATLRRLLRRTDLPEMFLQTLKRHPDREVRDAARLYVSIAPSEIDVAEEISATARSLRPSRGTLPELLDLDLLPSWLAEPLAGSANWRMRDELLAALGRSNDEKSAALSHLYRRAGAQAPREDEPVRTSGDLNAEEMRQLAGGGRWARKIAAAHPATPPEILRRLAQCDSLPVRRIALHHPYVGEEVLWTNAGSPDASLRRAVATNRSAPEALLDQLSKDTDATVRRAVAYHRGTPEQTLARLADDADVAVRRSAVANPFIPGEALARRVDDPDGDIRLRVARNARTPFEVIEQLGRDKSSDVRAAVARRRCISDELLAQLCCDENSHVRLRAALNRSLHDDVRDRLFRAHMTLAEAKRLIALEPRKRPAAPTRPPKRDSRRIRFNLPLHRYHEPYDFSLHSELHSEALATTTSAERLAELAQKKDRWVFEAVAGNKNTAPETLAQLYYHPKPTGHLFYYLATNPNTPEEFLEKFARDPNAEERRNVAHNPNVPARLLELLAGDAELKVVATVAWHARTPVATLEKLAQRQEPEILRALAGNAHTPEPILRQLAHNADEEMRARLAHNASLPADLRAPLLRDPAYPVRKSIASNTALTVAELTILLDDAEPAVREAALAHSALPKAAKPPPDPNDPETVRGALETGTLTPEEVESKAAHAQADIRAVVAASPKCPAHLLVGLASDVVENVRNAVLRNPSCPTEVLDRAIAEAGSNHLQVYGLLRAPALTSEHWRALAKHPDDYVRQTVAQSESAPLEILLQLLEDKNQFVETSLVSRRSLPAELIEAAISKGEAPVLSNLVRNRHTPFEIVCRILRAEQKPDGVYPRHARAAVAADKRTPLPFLLEMLERELGYGIRASLRWMRGSDERAEDYNVLVHLVRRPEIPIEKFEPLLDSDDRLTRRALLARPDLPPEWRERIRSRVLERARNGPALFARLAGLVHPSAPGEVMRRFAERGGWVERYAITQNPAAAPDLLRELAEDANIVIRTVARQRLADLPNE